ncbi:MAG: hypothetical protein ETSY1_32705 [Candidatus Entotheonella factor]|uniref:DUF2330 domain-containing protein n=2 Tax=Candidatus Entotheonella TaxID=93171 RepID=W4LC87_ENTF1|nr:MAG: hypothetical protein ETSY1_32705 [Candidatus Entotheonella factor]
MLAIRPLGFGLLCSCLLVIHSTAQAFCGFYVAKADTQLFNTASKVAMARHDNKTVITMANDYQGTPNEFAIVIPVPEVLKRDQIHVTEPAIVDHLDAYTAPRLVEYHDEDPCRPPMVALRSRVGAVQEAAPSAKARDRSLGVTIEAAYTVGEYDILILSAQESAGLETWLLQNDYRIPDGARPVLASYLQKGMKFFVAKVNLKVHRDRGTTYLRPLQVAFESDAFMLPIRLGMINASGPQELFIFMLTREGRVETVNYPVKRIPSNMQIPLYIKNEFGEFYRAMFEEQVRMDQMRSVFLEYAWDMGWCDPCAADPLSVDELRELGVFWQQPVATTGLPGQARDVFVTRLHLRYTAETFPHDLVFRETDDRKNFQGRYILRHPWKGRIAHCPAAQKYREGLPQRFESEARELAQLTGWELAAIRQKMVDNGQSFEPVPGSDDPEWYKKLWRK